MARPNVRYHPAMEKIQRKGNLHIFRENDRYHIFDDEAQRGDAAVTVKNEEDAKATADPTTGAEATAANGSPPPGVAGRGRNRDCRRIEILCRVMKPFSRCARVGYSYRSIFNFKYNREK